jgi:hypothetical protein
LRSIFAFESVVGDADALVRDWLSLPRILADAVLEEYNEWKLEGKPDQWFEVPPALPADGDFSKLPIIDPTLSFGDD